jgi:lipid A ethanolaminephosphotransferase
MGAGNTGSKGKSGLPALAVITAVSVWIGTAGNIALWQRLARLDLLHGLQGWGLAVALGAAISAVMVALLLLFAGRRMLKPALTVALVVTAFSAHFMSAYGVVIDSSMMVNVAQTDVREAADLVNGRLLVTVLLLGVLPAALVWRVPVSLASTQGLVRRPVLVLAALIIALVAIFAAFKPLSSLMRNHKEVRYLLNPLNVGYASARLAVTPPQARANVLKVIGADARIGRSFTAAQRPLLLVLVLGETARSANFALNGYARNTNPELQKLDVLSFTNVTSCGTSTAASVPCMFSPVAYKSFGRDESESENLLDVIQRAGLAVLWLDNQSGCKGVCDRVASANVSRGTKAALCPGGECYDEMLLEQLDERLNALPAAQRARGVVVVMHQMGSHGPAYYKRSPEAFKAFGPECKSTDLQDCSREALINAYDNSIVYTDHFLASVVRWLEARQPVADTAMVYVSDHGESLGEANIYLHGLPNAIAPDVQKKVPWISWFSESCAHRRHLSRDCLGKLKDQEVSHAHYFHSVLGLLDIETASREASRDIYGRCSA